MGLHDITKLKNKNTLILTNNIHQKLGKHFKINYFRQLKIQNIFLNKLIQALKTNTELHKAIFIVWQISALVAILILSLVFLTNQDFLLSKIPTCPSRLEGKTCVLCGSSRAFFEIKNLNFQKAFQLNKASIFIFFGLLINAGLLITYHTKNLRK